MSKEKKNSGSNKYNKKEKNITETNNKSKDTKKNKNEKKVEKKIIEEAIIENEELDEIIEEENIEIDEDIEIEDIEIEDIEDVEIEDIDIELDEEENDDEETLEDEEDIETYDELDEIDEDEDNEDEIDEDNEEEDNEEEVKIVEIPAKKEIKEEKVNTEKLKKIEKIAKEKKKKNPNKPSKLKDFGLFLEENRHIISGFIAGTLLTILVVIIIWPDRIATLKDGTQPVVKVAGKNYTANELYDVMKSHYSVSQLIDIIDTDILTKKYKETKEMIDEVEDNAEYYLNMYEQYYGYTEEQFLSSNGFASYEDFLEYLKLDYRRKKYLDEYVEENLEENEIKDYYDENVYGDINCQHVLVEISNDSEEEDKLSDEDAKKLAEEIIDKINDGTSWEDIKKDYKDKITFEDLGYQSWDSDLEESFKTALKDLDDNSFSEEPVKTSYGYHVIYRLDQKKAPSLKKTKDIIIENIVSEKQKEDENLLYKALIHLREEKNIKFSDTDMKAKYETYKKQYEK